MLLYRGSILAELVDNLTEVGRSSQLGGGQDLLVRLHNALDAGERGVRRVSVQGEAMADLAEGDRDTAETKCREHL